jgi:hypothetical protein
LAPDAVHVEGVEPDFARHRNLKSRRGAAD